MGKGIPDVELDIFNEDGQSVGIGEVGEIVARGDNIMLGYLNDDELTAKTLKNGWLYTGDLAQKDEDGFFFITARTKEIIKVGGNRVSPKEVESVILATISSPMAVSLHYTNSKNWMRSLCVLMYVPWCRKKTKPTIDAQGFSKTIVRKTRPG